MNICIICNKKFKAKRKSTKCCSELCRKEAKDIFDSGFKLLNLCVICKNEFKTNRKNAKYCSNICRKKSSCVELLCQVCFSEFKAKKGVKTCSQNCRNIYINNKDIQEFTCDYCFKEFERSKAYSGSGNINNKHFCSHTCASKHYVYRTYGKQNKYSTDWGKTRLEVFKIFGKRCITCNSNSNINVHHVIPKKYFSKNPKLSDNIEYLIPLCQTCHIKTHKENNSWFELNFKNIEDFLL